MSAIASLAKFAAGSAIGATLGAAVGLMVAPKSGEQIQADTAAFVDRLKTEGELAKREAEEQMAERFRQKVGDSSAFTQKA